MRLVRVMHPGYRRRMKKAIAIAPEVVGGTAAARLASAQALATAAARRGGHAPPTLIAVSKTVPAEAIRPFLAAGHRHFGENRVQEAQVKWPALRAEWPDVQLHLVGQLQSNKARDAVALFDCIHSVDRPSLIAALAAAMAREERRPALLAQVNIGGEAQKGGVAPADLPALLAQAQAAGLAISGLMTVPPADREPSPFFALLAQLARDHHLPWLSMGMSGDFDIASQLGATHIRIGTSLFGERKS